ncbi:MULTISPECIES: HAD family hydrolase [unclassified Ruegeria]|uniref:HAD family hydrolase n=1 Tax=unclassified Ruegeria TaxID=2625375 RepID=UPI001ADA896A|nr:MULTISPECIES: HAD family hydrolase [unclassified Ruegeria]MBO9411471.1 haloacid dehalogenase-like hydrolase [Ruegeria sp. R8_1]MBO9415967.1 haloacid dehalogenase-like hydrolase [Ruegeria sp. R8_2]
MAENTEFKQNVVALVYDFDGTLSPEAMQHYGVLPELDVAPKDFWADVKSKRVEENSEELLVYMREMIAISEAKRVRLDRSKFNEHGKEIKFFDGVSEWFSRIEEFAKGLAGDADVQLEHYVVSSGLREMIEGCDISHHFKEIYACEFYYDQYGHPKWPARVISDTSKTQYLFRINKGVLDVNESINSHMPRQERRIPFDNMIYFGDGDTDVPSMAVVMQNGGHAVAVHKPGESHEKCLKLKEAKRIDYFCPADFREDSELDRLVKDTLRVIVSRVALRQRIFELPPRGEIRG